MFYESGVISLEKPVWLKVRHKADYDLNIVEDTIGDLSIHTVCDYAACPNRSECYGKQTATFLILGSTCTRTCKFCNIEHQREMSVDEHEPALIKEAVKRLNLKHVVITSVTRDDLKDGGADHFVKVIDAVKCLDNKPVVEVLIPDLNGNKSSIESILKAEPEVFGHNVETVSRLYPDVRPEAVYQRSLEVLQQAAQSDYNVHVKSGFMLGLGETEAEVIGLLEDLYKVGCKIVTIGQYLAPSLEHYPVIEYIEPSRFKYYKRLAYEIGFIYVASDPFVRSSYMAHEAMIAIENSQM